LKTKAAKAAEVAIKMKEDKEEEPSPKKQADA